MENRVVITGLGIWSSIGTSLGEVTESLREGRSGIGLDPERRELGYISALTGIVKRPELKGALDRRDAQRGNGRSVSGGQRGRHHLRQ